MATDRIARITELLAQTEAAHGVFETTELKGVYDDAWPAWYARYAVEHGIAGPLGRPITADELAGFLTSSWAEFQRSEPRLTDSWAAYTARRIVAEP